MRLRLLRQSSTPPLLEGAATTAPREWNLRYIPYFSNAPQYDVQGNVYAPEATDDWKCPVVMGTMDRKLEQDVPYRETVFKEISQTARIDSIHGISLGVCVLVQCGGIEDVALMRIHSPEPAFKRVVIACPEMVETGVLVEALAAVQIGIGRRPRAGDLRAEGIERVRVRDGAASACQESHVPVPVVAVEAGHKGTIHQLIFANPL